GAAPPRRARRPARPCPHAARRWRPRPGADGSSPPRAAAHRAAGCRRARSPPRRPRADRRAVRALAQRAPPPPEHRALRLTPPVAEPVAVVVKGYPRLSETFI